MVASRLDIGKLLDEGRWTTYQKLFTMLAAVAVMFDGFDIQILGFAIPSIMREWHVTRADFAPVLAIGLAGMALGSPLAGYCGDRWGRRIALLASVVLFGAATVATAFSHGLVELAMLRFLTGMGAGGALPNASALATEFAPLRRRPVAVTLTIVCVPLGGMIGGFGAARILPLWGWHTLYVLGGGAPALLALVLLWLLPESPRYLARHPGRWGELVKLLDRMGHRVAPESQFEDRLEAHAEKHLGLRCLFLPAFRRNTIGLWVAFFSSLTGVYLVFGWLPAMLTEMGFDVGTASSGLAAYNFGGVIGVMIWAWLISASGSRGPLVWAALGAAATPLAMLFLSMKPGEGGLLLVAGFGLHGLFVNAIQVALFALAAHVYPTAIRATGVAAAAAIGRVGGLVSSFAGAAVIQAGSRTYLTFLSICVLGAGAGILVVTRHFEPQRGVMKP